MFRISFIIVLMLFFSGDGLAMKRANFPITRELKGTLTSLLDKAVDLHQAFYSKKEDQMRLTLLRMINTIEVLEQSPQSLPYHQKSYISKLLRELKPKLETLKNSHTKTAESINSINRSLTYMAHVYGLKKYVVFFCPKDRSVWMQGQNTNTTKPLHLEYQSCGAPVGK